MRHLPTSLLSRLAGIFLLACRAGAFEPLPTDTDGAIRTWRTAAGLPADSVTAIIQTRDGDLWIGTSAGVVRFDGVRFTEVRLTLGSVNPPRRITALCEDSRGHIWVGTQQDGLFELGAGTVRRYLTTRGLLDDTVTSLAAGTNGYVWIGTKAGLNLATGTELKSFTTREGLPDELVMGVHVARSGTVWITTRAGMCQYVDGHIAPYALQTDSQGRSPEYLGAYEDRRGNLWAFGDTYLINLAEGKRFNYFRGNEATSVRIWSLCEGRDGRLWIGTSGRGLFCFEDNRFQPVVLGELRWPYDVRTICEDREGNLWLGTSGGGLVQLRPQPVHVMHTGQGLPASSPTALALDANGRVTVGLQRGGVYVGENGRFEPLPASGGLGLPDFVSSLAVARDGTVWVGTMGGGLFGFTGGRGIRFTTANGLADDTILAVCVDRAGDVWASTSAGTLHQLTATNVNRYEARDGLPPGVVTVLVPRAAGGLWLGMENGALLTAEGGKFTPLQITAHASRRAVLAMHESDEEQLWIGTSGGLTWWSRGASMHWTTASGLPSDYIAGVVTDSGKNLWLATDAGIYRVSPGAIQKSLADPQSPLVCKLMSEAKTTAEAATVLGGSRALLSGEGRLWFATSEGVLDVDTRRPELENAPLPVLIENVSINGDRPRSLLAVAAWAAGPRSNAPMLLRNLRSLEIEFTALSFTAPEKVRFRHKLEGFDPDWVDDGSTRRKRFDRLPYGNYRFRVAARVADGPWQEAANDFAFKVPTPLYLRSWAIAAYGLAAVILVAGIVREVSHRRLRAALARLEQQQSLERERMRIARDMHDEMGSKLTKISFLSEHARMDVPAAGPLAGRIESIAETSRDLLKTMDEIVWVVNPRNDTVEHLAAYLSHHADEYFQNTSVECEIRLPQSVSHIPLSSETRHNLFLAFEEALNNVLKHSGATKVKIEMTLNAPQFEILVTDNGSGFEPGAAVAKLAPRAGNGGRGGNGLKHMQQRLSEIGGECGVRSRPGAGTTVSLRIHLNSIPEVRV